jgi:hypothetical protein
MKELVQGLVAAIKDNNFQSIAKDGVEVVMDSFLKDGVIKDIPCMGMLSGLFNLNKSVRDQMFLKKIMRFLIHSETSTTPEERLKVIQEIDDSKEHRIKVGEKLMYILDKFDDDIKAGIFGYLYKEFGLRKLKYNDLLRCALVLDKCLVRELDFFLKNEPQTEYDLEKHSELLDWGLLSIAPLDISLEQDGTDETKLEGGRLALKISKAGNLLRFHLKEYLQDQLDDIGISSMDISEARKYFEKIKRYPVESRNVYISEFILKLCNNYEISEADFSDIVSETARGKLLFGSSINGRILAYKKGQDARGNEYNAERWQKFYEMKKEGNVLF